MIKIRTENSELIVTPKPDDMDISLSKMRFISPKKWDSKLRAWIVPREKINEIISLFGINIEFETPIEKCIDDLSSNIYTSTEGFNGLTCTPYPFQYVAANFAVNKERCLIADVMGLGKTISALAAYDKIHNTVANNVKMIVISPASVKYQWQGEVADKTIYKSIVIDSPSKFKGKTLEERTKNAIEQFSLAKDKQIIITNYETLLNEKIFNEIVKLDCSILVIDECHLVKNKDAKRSKQLYKLAKNMRYVIGLSGTPLENRPPELYGVFQAIDPVLFPSWSQFASRHIKYVRYGIIAGFKRLDELRKDIQPYIIRRTLKDVSVQIPKEIPQTRVIEMTDCQKKLHNQIYEEILDGFETLDNLRGKFGNYDSENPPEAIRRVQTSVLSKYSFLLEVCDSPELISMSESKVAKSYNIDNFNSPKLDELYDIVEQVINQGDKIVIFTCFEKMLRIIKARLENISKIAVISGSVDAKEREVQKKIFNEDKECGIMLLTDAGNFGVNLQNANYLVMFEPPLKPSIYDQRKGRIIRINSVHENAFIINLVMENGWDQKIYDILDKKRQYTVALIDKTKQESVTFNKAADNIQNDMNAIIRKMGAKKDKKK